MFVFTQPKTVILNEDAKVSDHTGVQQFIRVVLDEETGNNVVVEKYKYTKTDAGVEVSSGGVIRFEGESLTSDGITTLTVDGEGALKIVSGGVQGEGISVTGPATISSEGEIALEEGGTSVVTKNGDTVVSIADKSGTKTLTIKNSTDVALGNDGTVVVDGKTVSFTTDSEITVDSDGGITLNSETAITVDGKGVEKDETVGGIDPNAYIFTEGDRTYYATFDEESGTLTINGEEVNGVVKASLFDVIGTVYGSLKTVVINTPVTLHKDGAYHLFETCQALEAIQFGENGSLAVSGTMEYMFANDQKLTNLDWSKIQLTDITSMAYAFYWCSGMTSIDLSNADLEDATSMKAAFMNCTGLQRITFPEGWTAENVTTMEQMFLCCWKLIEINNTARWNVNTQISMYRAFEQVGKNTTGGLTLDLSGFPQTMYGNNKQMFKDSKIGTLILCEGSNLATDSGPSRPSTLTPYYLINKPTVSGTTSFTCSGDAQGPTLTGYDSAKMSISGNSETAAGVYTLSVTPKATVSRTAAYGGPTGTVSYMWSDKTTDAITASWSISHNLEHHDAQAASCTANGNSAYWSCSGCGKYFSDAEGTTEIATDSWVITATGHAWGEPTYEWADDDSTVTATRVCAHGDHPETETVNTTSEVTTVATCEAKGTTTYTATFTNEAFAEQTKEVQNIDELGHSYGAPVWAWTGYTAATATFTCVNDNTHTQVVNAAITSEVTTPANYGVAGTRTYTATVTLGEHTYTDTTSETIPALVYVDDGGIVIPSGVVTPTTDQTETVDIEEEATPLAALPENLSEFTVAVTDENGETTEVAVSELPTVYADVEETAWSRDAIAYVSATGLMNGVGNNADGEATFSPTTGATGDMLTTVIYRTVSGETTSGENWADDAVAWAEETGLTDGIGLESDKTVTREQMVTMMYRAAEAQGFDVTATNDLLKYTDADKISDYARAAMEWAVSVGLIEGTDVDKLSPDAEVTREQIATILMRFNEMTNIKA